MATLAIDNNILYYYDDVKSIEITTTFKQYGDEQSLTLEMDCQGIQGDETYPVFFVSRKEIFSDTELVQTIHGCIALVSTSSDFVTSPFEQSIVKKYATAMIDLYGM